MPKLKSTSFRVKSPLIAKSQLRIAQSNSVKKTNHQPSIIYSVYIYIYIWVISCYITICLMLKNAEKASKWWLNRHEILNIIVFLRQGTEIGDLLTQLWHSQANALGPSFSGDTTDPQESSFRMVLIIANRFRQVLSKSQKRPRVWEWGMKAC